MAKITRKTQKIFAGGASNNGQFGSARAGTFQTSNDIAVLQSLAAFTQGWADATISGQNLPTLEELQALHFITTSQIGYLLQDGIAEYDAGTTYYQKSIVKKAGTYELYGSLIDDNVGQSLADVSKWTFLFDMAAITAAYQNPASYAADTGSANTIVIAPSPARLAYNTGDMFLVKPIANSTGAATINVNGLGAKSIKLVDGTDPTTGMIVTTGMFLLVYNGTNMILINPKTAATSGLPYASAGGTANALTATYSPAVTLTDGMTVLLVAASANTTTATFSPNGLTAKTIHKGLANTLAPGDIIGAGHILQLTYRSSVDKWILENPAGLSSVFASSSAMTYFYGYDGAEQTRRASRGEASQALTATQSDVTSETTPGSAPNLIACDNLRYSNRVARAWINFNASSGTPTITQAFNVTSITDNAVGDYTLNFTNALANANYNVSGISSATLTTQCYCKIVAGGAGGVPTTKTTSALRVSTGAAAAADAAECNFLIFGTPN